MGFYHSTEVLYGARLDTDSPVKTAYHVLDLEPAQEILNRFGINYNLANRESREPQLFLYTEYLDLDIGEYHSTAGEDPGKIQLWTDRLNSCVKALGMEFAEEPGWVTVHDYS